MVVAATALPGSEPVRVLFVGNSYTYYHNLPEMFAALAAAGGRPVETGMAALGGGRLKDDIADVIITHPHPDHINGIDLFPKSMLWMQKDDYDYFVGAAWQKGARPAGFEKEDVRKIVEANLSGRLTLVKGDTLEILPGIRVFTGSRHTWESQYLVVATKTDPVLVASDAIWFYYNLDHLVAIPTYTFDADAYVGAMKRMTELVAKRELIIPGHDAQVFDRFPRVADGIVRIR